MPPRRTHRKSRHGCLTCKQRRVKCDESGLPCENCKGRALQCEYASPPSNSQGHQATAEYLTPDSEPEVQAPRSTLDNQLLQLRLMHRWATTTYKTVCDEVAQDDLVWQLAVPELALKHEFLRNALFAVTAFEMASEGGSAANAHIKTALEYKALTFQTFQPQLCDISPDSHEAVLYCSLLLLVLALAATQFPTASGEADSRIQNAAAHFDLIRGIGAVMLQREDRFLNHPLFSKVKPFTELPRKPLDLDTEATLHTLSELNEARITSGSGEDLESRQRRISHAASCKTALFWLREYLETCHEEKDRSHCLGWISMAGADYAYAIKDNDRIALLILMCWATLIEKLGRKYWWARNFGKSLIEEVCMGISDDIDAPAESVIQWARGQLVTETNIIAPAVV